MPLLCEPSFQQLLLHFVPCFSAPSAETFVALAVGWVVCTGKRTVTGIIRTLEGTIASKSHDAYQYFFSRSVWEMERLWKRLFLMVVRLLMSKDAIIHLGGDDTLFKHWGGKIWGAGMFRDAVRSTKHHVAYARGHNWIILAAVIPVPFLSGHFWALPVMARLAPKRTHRPQKKRRKRKNKSKPPLPTDKGSHVWIMKEMIETVQSWLPKRKFRVYADGAYASLAGMMPENVSLVSRIRKDAALYALPPSRTGRPGAPRKKGRRLPAPQQTCLRAARKQVAQRTSLSWNTHHVWLYGKNVKRQLYAFTALWYNVAQTTPVKVVIIPACAVHADRRDPERIDHDEFFFSTDTSLSDIEIVEGYCGRWSVEVTFQEAQQYMGVADPQARVENAVKRQAPFCLFLISLIKLWALTDGKTLIENNREVMAWYQNKPSFTFLDALEILRKESWKIIFGISDFSLDMQKILVPFINAISRAA